MGGKDLIWVLAAYFLGCFTVGYYWVRWRTGEDIRDQGSGHVGARNVGRRLGPAGFVATLVLDSLKGGLAVGAAIHFNSDPEIVTAVLFAVILGHIWPVQLRFKGGKGVAVSLGAWLVYSPPTLLILAALTALLWLWTRHFTVAGMIAYAVTPLIVFLCGLGPLTAFAMSGTAVLVVLAHRKNLRAELTRMMPSPEDASGDGRPGERSTL